MPISELEERIDTIEMAQTDECRTLVSLAGLDRVRDLRFGDFTECNFNGQDLRGFDFSGCDLRGSTFDGALIDTVNLDYAMFDPGALQRAADYADFLKRDLDRDPGTRYRVNGSRLRDLAVFREAPFASEMVIIAAGEFMMGCDLGDDRLGEDDRAWAKEIVPGQGKRLMRIPRRFAIGRYPVTFEEYDVFCEAEKREKPEDQGWGRKRRPVININWNDAQAFVAWLNGRLGGAAYRLPSEAEWEYACRAGTNTRRWWGDAWDPTQANGARNFEFGRTSAVGQFPENPWRLHDVIGNVWEWCADEWADNISMLPEDATPFGSATPRGSSGRKNNEKSRDNMVRRALRGGSWGNDPGYLRSAIRSAEQPPGYRVGRIGFRLFRTL